MPSVLGLNFHTDVAPKLNYLQNELDLSDLALRERLHSFPVLLGSSLEKRPRVALCRAASAPLDLVVSKAALTDDKFDVFLSIERRRRQRPLHLEISGS